MRMYRIGKSIVRYLNGGVISAHNNRLSRVLSSQSQSQSLLVNDNLKKGDIVHGYRIDAIEDISELCLRCYHLSHVASGAQHLHVERDDSNNTFAVLLRTPPNDSTGVTHILEHLALCGSTRYPCRDPFMKMCHRSLSTFMNAMTGADYTIYPFSSQNRKDYYNLMSIYLDSVFSPRLRELDFRQEGWRLEHENVDDANTPVIFKGVVFNEMKGVFSSPEQRYARQMINELFPSNTYANESGGDPICIPRLSHQYLTEFHKKHYHPSNARFYTYGNLPLENHLAFINEFTLNRYKFNKEFKESSYIPEQQRWKSSVQKSIDCQIDPKTPFADKQTTISVTYMLENVANSHENFMLAILGSLLTDGPNSPLYQSLIEAGLGSDFSPNSGYTNHTKQSMFSIGLKEVSKDDVYSIAKIIELTMKKASEDGFPMERIEAILHRIELSTKHQSTHFGLGLIFNLTPMWIHDANPIQGLRINEHINWFRDQLKNNPDYLKDKVKEYFLKNTHKLILEMNPNKDFESIEQSKENELLKEKLSQLNDEQKRRIFDDGIELRNVQEMPEDVSILPTLSVKNDVSREFKRTNIETTDICGVSTQYSPQPTNGITYFNAIMPINFNEFPQHLVPYLPLFAELVTKLGAGKFNRNDLDQEINLRTGGLNVSVVVTEHPSQPNEFESGLMLSSHCLERNIEHMFNLWENIFTNIRFDDDRKYLQQLIKMLCADITQFVPQWGHKYAMSRSASLFGGAHKMRELTSGLASLSHIRKTAAITDSETIVDKFKHIQSLLLQKNRLRCAINTETHSMRPSLQSLERFYQSMNSKRMNNFKDNTSNLITSLADCSLYEHNVFPYAVNYLAKANNCVPFTHNDYAKLKIASKLVSAKYLHKEIREKGGAYGGGAVVNNGGVFLYYSYRDPHINETIDAFNSAPNWLIDQNSYTDIDIDEAKLTAFQDVDKPIMPNEQGLEYFIKRISDEMMHDYRLRLLDVTKNDIIKVTQRYLLNNNHCATVLLGPRSDITVSDSKWVINEEKPQQ